MGSCSALSSTMVDRGGDLGKTGGKGTFLVTYLSLPLDALVGGVSGARGVTRSPSGMKNSVENPSQRQIEALI